MKIKYQGYWGKKVKSEAHSVSKWDTWNSTKFEKKVDDNKMSSLDVAEHNHQNHLGYEVIFFEDELFDEFPYCLVTILPRNKHVGIHFIDPGGRDYLSYLFTEIEPLKKLFLREVWYKHYKYENDEEEEYRLNFVFDQEISKIGVSKYDDKAGKMEQYESNRTFDFSGLYEDYPEFGEYDNLTKINRDFPIDMPPGNTDMESLKDPKNKKYIYKDGTRYYKDEDGNLIEDN